MAWASANVSTTPDSDRCTDRDTVAAEAVGFTATTCATGVVTDAVISVPSVNAGRPLVVDQAHG